MGLRFSGRRNSFGRRSQNRNKDNGDVAARIKAAEYHSANASANTAPTPAFIAQHTFADFGVDPRILANITQKGYTSPTPIQDQVIPVLLQGRDVIGIANTGTGKTATFLIPLIQKILLDRTQRVLVVTPTRELALQIHEELQAFSTGLGIHGVLIIGGASAGKQRMELSRRPAFVIGTPGRIKDLVSGRVLQLSGFSNVVLDEADRMVDIGFINDIRYFISLLPKQRQSLFFSATVTEKVREIIGAFVTDPVTISVKTRETAENVEQQTIRVPKEEKLDKLHDLLIQPGFDKVLVFGRTKWGVQKLALSLEKRGFKADAIHGNKRQSQRQRTLERFKNNEIQILLATDVASRGLDIEDVTHVINFDVPATYDDYVHRIGRTGRAEKKGVAVTFVD